MASFKFALLMTVGLALFGASSGDPCSDGSTCCSDCSTACVGNTIACFRNCESPCFSGQYCRDLGMRVAQGVAVGACEKTKRDCGVGPFNGEKGFVAPPSLDLTGCCKVVSSSCLGNAANITCTKGSYGKCQDWEFKNKFQSFLDDDCKNGTCSGSACKDALRGDPSC